MINNLIYPDELLYYEELEEFYETLVINPGSFLESMQNMTLFDLNNSLAELLSPSVNKKIKNTNYHCTDTNKNLGMNHLFLKLASIYSYVNLHILIISLLKISLLIFKFIKNLQ